MTKQEMIAEILDASKSSEIINFLAVLPEDSIKQIYNSLTSSGALSQEKDLSET